VLYSKSIIYRNHDIFILRREVHTVKVDNSGKQG